jgi:hypothetical protein
MSTILLRTNKLRYQLINYFIALVWLINGFFCKVLNMVPRHKEIVSKILGESYAEAFTKFIGLCEVLMAIWIITRIKPSFCAVTQIFVILLMNIIEFYLAPNLLLFGRINLLVAALFSFLIFYNEFILSQKIQPVK